MEGKHVFMVNADEQGKELFSLMRKSLNPRYSIIRRGRGNRAKGVGATRDLRVNDAERWAIYITPKDEAQKQSELERHNAYLIAKEQEDYKLHINELVRITKSLNKSTKLIKELTLEIETTANQRDRQIKENVRLNNNLLQAKMKIKSLWWGYIGLIGLFSAVLMLH